MTFDATIRGWAVGIIGAGLLLRCGAPDPRITTALDVARVACNAVAEARAAELSIPKAEAFARFCDTRDAIAPWVAAAEHAGAAIDAGAVLSAEAGE